MVVAVDNDGLYYFGAGGRSFICPQCRIRYSPPVLVRCRRGRNPRNRSCATSRAAFSFRGSACPARGWPIALDGALVGHEDLVPVPPPVVDDVNGDGEREIIFLVAGDIHSFDFTGRETERLAPRGEGARGGPSPFSGGTGHALHRRLRVRDTVCGRRGSGCGLGRRVHDPKVRSRGRWLHSRPDWPYVPARFIREGEAR